MKSVQALIKYLQKNQIKFYQPGGVGRIRAVDVEDLHGSPACPLVAACERKTGILMANHDAVKCGWLLGLPKLVIDRIIRESDLGILHIP